MSIKRISRTRVAAPITEYVDEEPLAMKIDTKEDNRVGTNVDVRVGGDVETKASTAVESRAEPASGKDSPTKSRWSV